ncbi:macro domain-containing protein [bacterium]|nr:macro domain-containing protein [bacterium]
MKVKKNKTAIRLVQGDITDMETEAIVNAANSRLAHGGGVAGMIVRKGGPTIQEESDIWVKVKGGSVPVGTAAITTAGSLPCRYVIHAVGPRMGEGDEDRKLEQATRSALETAVSHHIRTIAFPAISTGIFGYPMDRCAKIMLATVWDFIAEHDELQEVVFCLYGQEAFDTFAAACKELT